MALIDTESPARVATDLTVTRDENVFIATEFGEKAVGTTPADAIGKLRTQRYHNSSAE